MHIRRWTVSGVAVLAALALTVTGCGPKDDSTDSAGGTTSAAPKVASPKDTIAAAAAKAKDKALTVKITTSGGMNGEGKVSPADKAGQISMKVPVDATHTVTLTFLTIADQHWVKIVGIPGISGAKWQHVDVSKLTDADSIPLAEDMTEPGGAVEMLEQALTAEKVGDGQFKCTVDATKLSGGGMVDDELVKNLGAGASSLAFDVTLDSTGQLATVSFTAPDSDAKPETYKLEYSGWGATSAVTAPAKADVVEASKAVYDMLND